MGKHNRDGEMLREVCGTCHDAIVECTGCGLFLCECTRTAADCHPTTPTGPTPAREPHQREDEREALATLIQTAVENGYREQDVAEMTGYMVFDADRPLYDLPWFRAADAVLAARQPARDVEAVAKVLREHFTTYHTDWGYICSCGWRPSDFMSSVIPAMADHQAAQIAALTPARGVSAETHTEWGVRIEGRQEVVSAHHDSREKAERGAATWVALGDGRTAQIVRREVTDWREVRDVD